jgi:hypothetical protein
MDNRQFDLPTEVEKQWREWSRTESTLSEAELKRAMMERTRDRYSRRRTPLVLAAAAAGLVAVLIGLESNRRQSVPIGPSEVGMVHETSENVILVLREGRNPIYVVTDSSADGEGGRP